MVTMINTMQQNVSNKNGVFTLNEALDSHSPENGKGKEVVVNIC